MKILIFENEYADLEPAIKAINLIYFNNDMEVTQFNTSQELGDIENIEAFNAIIVDIDLSLKSHKDGFGILQDIKSFNPKILQKTMVLTGSSKVEDKLNELGLGKIKIAFKPVVMEKVADILKKFFQRA